ncbi:AAA family ATPase [Roseibacillus ishigakijimensis]|uniref:MoxR family ATPase n=1 Tax=Roseibacillus ishigakijimensis TaxID=454146 RepID=A0A934RN41_9BACT|nr:MoxR family ATPase [Roseibacillus ishigakijimensis]MBK1833858.1 MoxR family ATPase [Roseibacillus ishigakijimensis]
MADTTTDTQKLSDEIAGSSRWISDVRQEMSRVLIGQNQLVDRLLLGLLCNGHILLEGLPGLAKTLAVNTLSSCFQLQFSRIQFTPDLLPADLLGTLIYNPQQQKFDPKLGPIFANLVLADEVNRSPAKVQAALLEAMQERQVTLGDTTYPLPEPFLVLATQNPIDQEGTYTLPEAQLDRFLLKVLVDYPSKEEEMKVLDLMANTSKPPAVNPVAEPAQLAASRQLLNRIYIDPAVREYIVDLVHATRSPLKYDQGLVPLIRAGASPRATINLALTARAHAFMNSRAYVTPQDVKSLAPEVLRHRILLSYEAEAENISTDTLISRLLSKVPVP